MKTGYNEMGGATGMSAYHEASAAKCPLHQTCDCCTCRRCGLCILICWVIFGGYSAISSLTFWTDKNLTTVPDCQAVYQTDITGECCEFSMGGNDYITAGSCSDFQTAGDINAADGILSVIAGITGIVGMAMYTAWLILIPAGWAILSVILGIIGVVMIGWGTFAYAYIFGFGIAVLIAILFYSNYKIMKETDPKSG
eukprot:550965_1